MKTKTTKTFIPAPFASGEVRARNRARPAPEGHTEQCLFCERALAPARVAYFVEMTTSLEIVPVGMSVEDSQGYFPVGSSCKNLVPATHRMTPATHPELFERVRARAEG